MSSVPILPNMLYIAIFIKMTPMSSQYRLNPESAGLHIQINDYTYPGNLEFIVRNEKHAPFIHDSTIEEYLFAYKPA